MAEKLGITQGNYSKMELGKLDIPFSKLEEISKILGLGVVDVVSFNENIVFNLKDNKKANGLVINQVSPSEEKLYKDYIESLKAEITQLKQIIAHQKQTIDKLLNKK